MPTIEIDFEVFKHLTMRRASEEHSYNEVLRELLGLPADRSGDAAGASSEPKGGWVSKGVHFPEGTALRATYKGKEHFGSIEDGGIVIGGKPASSLSNAATLVTGNNVDGWKFWDCRFPGEAAWRSVASLREAIRV